MFLLASPKKEEESINSHPLVRKNNSACHKSKRLGISRWKSHYFRDIITNDLFNESSCGRTTHLWPGGVDICIVITRSHLPVFILFFLYFLSGHLVRADVLLMAGNKRLTIIFKPDPFGIVCLFYRSGNIVMGAEKLYVRVVFASVLIKQKTSHLNHLLINRIHDANVIINVNPPNEIVLCW